MGALWEIPTEGLTYIAFRNKPKDIWWGKQPTLQAAIDAKLDAYAVNVDTIRELSRLGCEKLAVKQFDTKDFFITPFRHYTDPAVFEFLGHVGKGVPPQRAVPRSLFRLHQAPIKLTARGKRKPRAPLSAAAIT